MKSLLAILISFVSIGYADDCTYNIPVERVYFEGYVIEVGQSVDPIMQELGYKKSGALSADYLIDTYFSTLPTRPLESASLMFTVYDKETNIVFERLKTTRCYTQICSTRAAYKILNKVLADLERRFPKCN